MSERPAEGTAEEAARWFARLRSDDCSARERARFSEWLEDEDNGRAYSDCMAVWDEIRDAASDDAILAMRREALALGPAPQRRFDRWAAGITALAAAVALVVLVGNPARFDVNPEPESRSAAPEMAAAAPQTYRTEVGQSATATLADGSRIELNTDTELRVDFRPGERRIALLKGQALFRVAPDKSRPFVVEAGGRTITALGTVFDVNLAGEQLSVTLVEGRVAIAEQSAGTGSLRPDARTLVPGQQLVVNRWQEVDVRPAAIERVTSWRKGRVIFEDQPLAEVIGEINRYSERRLVLGDPSLAELRVSGVFRTGSVTNFAAALSASFPVRTTVDPASNAIVVLPARAR